MSSTQVGARFAKIEIFVDIFHKKIRISRTLQKFRSPFRFEKIIDFMSNF